MTDKQAEALELAGDLSDMTGHYGTESIGFKVLKESAAELRRLHARVVELEEGRRAIIAEKDEYKLALRQARADLEAIGAGGVESFRGTKPLTHDSIADWVSDTWPMDKKFSLAEIESRIRANGIGS